MASPTVNEVPREIRSILAGLRWRIRAYVWLEGLSLAVVWLGLTFWAGLALDYLPVLAGIGEMPRLARGVLLAGISFVLAAILYRWIFRRVFVRLADRSMAMLIERRHRGLAESLITVVELAGKRGELATTQTHEMLAETRRHALSGVRDLELGPVLNLRPLAMRVAGALFLSATIGLFYVANASAWELGFERLYLLTDRPWPRVAQIEVLGIDVRNEFVAEGERPLLPFRNRTLKVAKGSSLGMVVRADAARRKVPEICTIHYQTADGDYGRVNMTRIGRVRDGYQLYRYEGKPFDGILSDIEFDVVGFDHRVSEYQLQVVDSPVVVETTVACRFPSYMVDEKLSLWLPRTMDLTTGTQLPRGTQLTIHARSNKPLQRVSLNNPDANESVVLEVSPGADDPQAFSHKIEALGDHLTLDVSLLDTDDVTSDRPFRMHISGIEDTPPVIEMRLQGIGTAITPDARVPAVGKVTDDYGLARSWIEAVIDDGEPREYAVQPSPAGEAERVLDFREERSVPTGMTLQPGVKLHLTVKALDRCDLGSGPNQAAGDHYQLEVVTPEHLLTLLEARELGLRRRLEQVIGEMQETRDMLVRVRADGPDRTLDENAATEAGAGSTTDQPGGEPPDAEAAAAEQLKRIWALRLLRARQSLLQSQKSSQEVLGIAVSFRDIYEELINNRVDTEDRKRRIKDEVSEPLQRIGETRFAELDQGLESLAKVVAEYEARGKLDSEDPQTVEAARTVVESTNQILRELDAVLQRMLDLESFNELLDIVRSLIEDQERVTEETKKEQKRAVLDLLK